MPGNIHRIDPTHPDPALIERAVRTIQTGGIIIFPTSGLYGLGADATRHAAVHRIFQIKRRLTAKPILVLIRDADQLSQWVTRVPERAQLLIDRFWPGSVTLVLNGRPALPPNLTAGTGKIGIRVPAHPVASALTHSAGFPVTATSANLSGQAGCTDIGDIPPSLLEAVDLTLNAGTLAGGSGSTVIDVTTRPLKILRPGTIPPDQIFSL